MSTISFTGNVQGSAHRRPSGLEAAAAQLGSALVRWVERRTAVPADWADRQRAAVQRREELNVLRNDVLGAAHSGLYRIK